MPSISPKSTFAVPSVDGRYLAASLSSGGSESGDVHVYETATGQPLPDVIARVNYATAGGGLVWNTDSSGFYYTRYPRDGERAAADMHFYQQVYFHKLGDKPENDTYESARTFPGLRKSHSPPRSDSRYIGVSVASAMAAIMNSGCWRPAAPGAQLASAGDEVKQIAFGYKKDIYLVSKHGAPRGKVLHMDVAETVDQATAIVPESAAVIESVAPTKDGPWSMNWRAARPRCSSCRRRNSGECACASCFQRGLQQSGWHRSDLLRGQLPRTRRLLPLRPEVAQADAHGAAHTAARSVGWLRGDAPFRGRERRHEGSAEYHPSQGTGAGWQPSYAAHGLRRIYMSA
jgi:hypothetical protein